MAFAGVPYLPVPWPAAALSLILLVLGAGLGFSAISPWAQDGATAKSMTTASVVWVSVMSLLASGLGGYLAGRLRRNDPEANVDEEYFRDTANGFLSWSLAILLTAGLLSSAIGSVVGGAAKLGASAMGGAVTAGAGAAATMGSKAMDDRSGSGNPLGYYVDTLFRPGVTSTTPPPTGTAPDPTAMPGNSTPAPAMPSMPAPTAATSGSSGMGNAEATQIFANAMHEGSMAPADRQYLAQMIAQRTGISQADAERRVNDTYNKMQAAKQNAETKARKAAEAARKVARDVAFWTFFSMLLGAFAASAAALLGSRHVIRHTATRV